MRSLKDQPYHNILEQFKGQRMEADCWISATKPQLWFPVTFCRSATETFMFACLGFCLCLVFYPGSVCAALIRFPQPTSLKQVCRCPYLCPATFHVMCLFCQFLLHYKYFTLTRGFSWIVGVISAAGASSSQRRTQLHGLQINHCLPDFETLGSVSWNI